MNKKETRTSKEDGNQNYETIKMNTSENYKKNKDKDLPWWVEFLFVQIGLPEKILIKFLKAKKKTKEFIKNDKKQLIKILFVISTLVYFYPVIKHSKNQLVCQVDAINYIIENKNITSLSKGELKMLATNICYGGEEIYEIENLKN